MRLRVLVMSFALVAGGLPALVAATAAPAGAVLSDHMTGQAAADATQEGCDNTSPWACGGWDSLRDSNGNVVGVSIRPYVKALSVINGYGTESETTQAVIDNPEGVPSPAPQGGTNLAATVSAVNLCGAGQTEAPPGSPPRCYYTPNRVQIGIGYDAGGGNLHRNFDGATTTPSVDANTVFDLTLALNTLGRPLRWSFLWGEPLYWNVTNIGQPDATLRVKFKPVRTPQRSDNQGCSAIPVMLCDATTADTTFLEAQLLLSLDTTLDPAFTGALFAASRAYIGSLEADPIEQPRMKYGVSAPLTIDGVVNTATFQAFVSDSAILNYFGATPDVAQTAQFRSSAFALTRADSGGGGSNVAATWSRWTAGANGSDGWFISIPNIAVTGTTGSLAVRESSSGGGLSPAALRVRPARFNVARKGPAPQVQLARTGSANKARVTVSFGVASTACNGTKKCRVVVTRLNAAGTTNRTPVGTVSATVAGGRVQGSLTSAAGVLRKNSRVSVMLQVQVGTQWRWVTSATGTVR